MVEAGFFSFFTFFIVIAIVIIIILFMVIVILLKMQDYPLLPLYLKFSYSKKEEIIELLANDKIQDAIKIVRKKNPNNIDIILQSALLNRAKKDYRNGLIDQESYYNIKNKIITSVHEIINIYQQNSRNVVKTYSDIVKRTLPKKEFKKYENILTKTSLPGEMNPYLKIIGKRN